MLEELPPFGLNVIGYVSANVGLGNTLRQFSDSFLIRGEKVSILDINHSSGRTEFGNSLRECFVSSANDLPYAINLSISGAIDLPRFALSPPDGLCVNDRLNVFFVWWELTNLPQHFIDAAKTFDVLIAGSDFVYHLLSNNVAGIPILRAPHPVSIPEGIQPNRKRFKLPEHDFIVFMGFDPLSNIDRKNPYAAIEAFKLAFPDNPNCLLAIKVNYSGGGSKTLEDNLNHLNVYVKSDPRIHLIQESLSYNDLLCLYASCDVFISLHRSEGLGLIPLEAMRLGKPVVATAWSGNMSYMNYNNACLVGFDFVPIEANSQYYGSDALGINSKWAEPNVLQASAWLRKLFDDTPFRLQLGVKAAADTKQYHELASKLDFVEELKTIWENREYLPQKDREFFLKKARESKGHFEYEKYLRKMRPIEKIVHNAKKEINRRLLWRFCKAEI